MDRPIFHLSFPVLNLSAAKTFYCDVLGASVGRECDEWMDIVLFGHQLTLHYRPREVLRPEERGVRHFGVVLPWHQWMALAETIEDRGCTFFRSPVTLSAGTGQESGKFMLCDPSDNLIEIKAYRNVDVVLGIPTRVEA